MGYTSNTDTAVRNVADYEIRISTVDTALDTTGMLAYEMVARMLNAISSSGMFRVVSFRAKVWFDSSSATFSHSCYYMFECVFKVTGNPSLPAVMFHMPKLIYNLALIKNGMNTIKHHVCMYSPATGRKVVMSRDAPPIADMVVPELAVMRWNALNHTTEEWLSGLDAIEKARLFCRVYGICYMKRNHPWDMKPYGLSEKFTSRYPDNNSNGVIVIVESGTYTSDPDDTSIRCHAHRFGTGVSDAGEFVVCCAYGPELSDVEEIVGTESPFENHIKYAYNIMVFTDAHTILNNDSVVVFAAEMIAPDKKAVTKVAKFAGINSAEARRYISQAYEAAGLNTCFI